MSKEGIQGLALGRKDILRLDPHTDDMIQMLLRSAIEPDRE